MGQLRRKVWGLKTVAQEFKIKGLGQGLSDCQVAQRRGLGVWYAIARKEGFGFRDLGFWFVENQIVDAGWKMKWTLGLCRHLCGLHAEASTIAVGFRL